MQSSAKRQSPTGDNRGFTRSRGGAAEHIRTSTQTGGGEHTMKRIGNGTMATRQPNNSTRVVETTTPDTAPSAEPTAETVTEPTVTEPTATEAPATVTEAPAAETPAETPAPTAPQLQDFTAQALAWGKQLDVEAKDLASRVERHQQYSLAMDLYAGPLRTFMKNRDNPSWENSYRIASTSRADVEGWAALLSELNQNIAYVVHELTPDALSYDLSTGDNIRGRIAKLLEIAGLFVAVSDEAQVLCNAVVAEWDNAKSALSRATGKGTVRVSSGNSMAPAPRVPSRGYGELVRNRGFMLTMQCDRCQSEAPLTSGSNKGSAQDAMANHFVTAHSEQRPRAGDPTHAAFTQAMNEVLNAPDEADVVANGGGFTIGKQHVTAA